MRIMRLALRAAAVTVALSAGCQRQELISDDRYDIPKGKYCCGWIDRALDSGNYGTEPVAGRAVDA
jgi:hypothetical protein